MTRRHAPNLFTIPASAPFLDGLADALLGDALGLKLGNGLGKGFGDDPAALADVTLYLPSRRAARSFAATLAARARAKALALPRIVPLGDPGEAELEEALLEEVDGEALDPPPIRPLRRQALLARLVQSAGAALGVGGFAQAFALAGDLAALLDALQAQGVELAALDSLDAARFDIYRQNSAVLLGLLARHWPRVLSELELSDPVAWRNQLLERARRRLDGDRPRLAGGPVVVAGSTGSMPATAALIRAVAWRRDGAVILPDLDQEASDAAWRAIARPGDDGPDRQAAHPQALLARLLETIGADRRQVNVLGASTPVLAGRRRLANEALRPAAATPDWRSLPERLDGAALQAALAGVAVAEAATAHEEAVVCALAIREALETPGRTVALVTPDRGLAERVGVELGRWGVTAEDSAGLPLLRSEAGSLATSILDIVEHGLSGAGLTAILSHARLSLGRSREDARAQAVSLITAALPGRKLSGDVAGWLALLDKLPGLTANHREPLPIRRLAADAFDTAITFGRDLAAALAPLLASGSIDHGERVRQLRACLAALTEIGPGGDADAFDGADGVRMAELLDELEAALDGLPGEIAAFAQIVRSALAGVAVRPEKPGHPRVAILGLIEARLMRADLMILGGLNEETWPGPGLTDPFLNRAMRAELGLPSPERRIGQTAHDFATAFSAPSVLLTRAVRSGDAQSIASRFWLRLRSVTPAASWGEAVERGAALIRLARALDEPDGATRAARPVPRPPAEAQPASYSVTEVETLFRDPYAIYAKRVLALEPLPDLDAEPDARDRGTLLHAVAEQLARSLPGQEGALAAIEAEALRIGAEVFAPLMGESEVKHFWWPRFVALAPRLAAWESARRAGLARIDVELRGAADFPLPDGGQVRLSARADRVEQLRNGGLALIDFKTGSPPSAKQIKAGLAPQLFLEAALASRVAFKAEGADGVERTLGPGPVADAAYVKLRAGDDDELKTVSVAKPEDLAERAERHLEGFIKLVNEFRKGERPFASQFAPEFMRHAGDYDHLARVDEWRIQGGGEDGDG